MANATVPVVLSSNQRSALSGHQHRRAMLRTLAAAGTVAAGAAAAVAHSVDVPGMVDPHIGWAEQIAQLRTLYRSDMTDAESDIIYEAVLALETQISTTLARTPLGIAEQIKLAIACNDEGSILTDEAVEALRLAVSGLQQLGGRA